ncbi:MAG: TlpA family protein disulfide reductase [Phycisphaerales bacterium]|nr:TlpA family protein disulfide reductase [Phycisphaerales bacterium]
MTRRARVAGLLLASAIFAAPSLALRPPAEILSELDAVQMPQFDASKRGDQAYLAEFQKARQEANDRVMELAKEFLTEAPDHEEAGKIGGRRWQTMMQSGQGQAMIEETKDFAAREDALGVEAAYWHALGFVQGRETPVADKMGPVEAFLAKAPTDERGASLLVQTADYSREIDQETKLSLYRRSLAAFPNARANKYVVGQIRRIDELNKPFELEFQEATSGETVSFADLKGKIVVVDFWATWCGPCVGEMPHMKELYAEWKDKGVEFVGISLDQAEEKGGLDKLKKFVKDNEIPWPQYYQGNYWDSEFSVSWGVNSIPCIFVVDHEGNLYSTNARGKLEELIPELMTKRGGN